MMTTIVLVAVGKVFDIVWDKSEGIKNEYPLHAALILETISASIMILALFRLIQVWHQVGQRGGGSGTRTLSIVAPTVTAIIMVVSIVGDILLVRQDQLSGDGEEDVSQTHMALLVKFGGSAGNITLVLIYMGLVIYLAYATKRRTTMSPSATTPITANLASIRKNPSLLVPTLALLGILILIRNAFVMATLGLMAFSDDSEGQEDMGWSFYVGLIAVPEILVIR